MNKLIVGGLGVKELKQMTIETLESLKRADAVLYLGVTPQRHLPQIAQWGAKNAASILELYTDGDVDENNYQRLCAAVLETAGRHPLTVLLVPGHPRIGVTLVQRLEKLCPMNGIALGVQPGISSFDAMLNDLARDPLEKGSVMIDANRMLLFDMRWDPTLDCYLYHVCSVGTRKVHLSDARQENSWDLLKQHLLTIYPKDARVELVSSSTKEENLSSRVSAPLSEIETLFESVHFGTTMFIPGQKPASMNKNFMNLLMARAK